MIYTALDAAVPAIPVFVTASCLLLLFNSFGRWYKTRSIPVVNKPSCWNWSSSGAKQNYFMRGEELIKDGLKTAKSFLLQTDSGRKLILSPDFAQEIKGHKDLDFRKYVREDMLSHTPGLEPFHYGATDDGLGPDIVKAKLTSQLPMVTGPLSEEASLTLEDLWTSDAEWHDIPGRETCLEIIARVSSRVFLGPKLCRDPTILKLEVDYTVISMTAIDTLKMWPRILRPFVHWVLPQFRQVRNAIYEFRQLMQPELERRKQERAECEKVKAPAPRYNDMIEWLEEVARGRPYDHVYSQLAMSLAAIHTTSDLLTKAIYNLCIHPEILQPLREEIVEVLEQDGWKKTSLSKLKLLDSFLKETQRMNPLNIVSMQRLATKDVRLADGTLIPKGMLMEIYSERMWNSGVHADPETFDPWRFLKMRQRPGLENVSQFVSTSTDHIAFGHGTFSCPGRFFASNELKIILVHAIMKYDLTFSEPVAEPIIRFARNRVPNPTVKLRLRRRKAEVDLDSLPV
ncbi:uncharacterized protein Z518_03600 [Rhinocladiella mackenziei CBS 650.93]|uniref:Cytochrome P450 monooxygenase n=1 Tax=Rhinocladiella mackenziei CBS 650.93 TaxID=1442369 RepID=A0A0D2H5E2_9EURO|nr:uncharacterized protein Z518_03600 [Rhinocladiella mackenziei CBS 650.93]KIX05628.1 hypothetical protein Z518_03600 [Rhinocladiella mackenziei CBS 650.93]